MFLFLIQFALAAAVAPQGETTQGPTCEAARSQAESSFRRRNNLKTRQQVEADLKRAVESCTSAAAVSRLERRLRTVQEEIAMTHLQIALFYPHADGVGLLKAALMHLRIVDADYRNFSQMDHVIFLLGDYSDRNGDANDAVKYFRRVIETYPRSSYAREARKRLAILAAKGETYQIVGPEPREACFASSVIRLSTP